MDLRPHWPGPSFESGLYGGFIGGAIGGGVLAIQSYLTNRGSFFISESELVWVSCMVVPYGAIVGTICGAFIQLGFIWGKRMSIGGMRIGALIGSIAGGILGGTDGSVGWVGIRDARFANSKPYRVSFIRYGVRRRNCRRCIAL